MSRRSAARVDLPSEDAAAPQAVLRTLVVTDLVDSTRLVEELGDSRRSLLHLGRLEEARPVLESLRRSGYRQRSLVEIIPAGMSPFGNP